MYAQSFTRERSYIFIKKNTRSLKRDDFCTLIHYKRSHSVVVCVTRMYSKFPTVTFQNPRRPNYELVFVHSWLMEQVA